MAKGSAKFPLNSNFTEEKRNDLFGKEASGPHVFESLLRDYAVGGSNPLSSTIETK
jgi:hypothetical protein